MTRFIVRYDKKRKDIRTFGGNYIVVGTKDIKTQDQWRDLGFKVSQYAKKEKIEYILINKVKAQYIDYIEGLKLGNYQYTYKKDDKNKKIDIQYSYSNDEDDKIKKLLLKVDEKVKAQNITRDFVNTPPNIANSEWIFEEIYDIFRGTNVSIELYDEEFMELNGMNGHLAVNAASLNNPMTIKLSYIPDDINKKTKHHIFVGKGLTYDSGGLSLKPTNSMVNMQADKAGAMTVLGLMSYLATNHSSSKVTAYLALAENMINESAYRPGDILTMKNGKTVKVYNTDAEGRIVLFDNLCLAQDENKNFDTITSIATLTGSAVMQFGDEAGALVGFNDKLKRKIQKCGKKNDEIFLDAVFHKYMMNGVDDDIADLSNTGTSGMGCQKAGLFLTNAIKKKNKNKFIHWDIAGPAFVNKGFGTNIKGATGFGVRTLIEFIN